MARRSAKKSKRWCWDIHVIVDVVVSFTGQLLVGKSDLWTAAALNVTGRLHT
jgi:hypothetical protein